MVIREVTAAERKTCVHSVHSQERLRVHASQNTEQRYWLWTEVVPTSLRMVRNRVSGCQCLWQQPEETPIQQQNRTRKEAQLFWARFLTQALHNRKSDKMLGQHVQIPSPLSQHPSTNQNKEPSPWFWEMITLKAKASATEPSLSLIWRIHTVEGRTNPLDCYTHTCARTHTLLFKIYYMRDLTLWEQTAQAHVLLCLTQPQILQFSNLN